MDVSEKLVELLCQAHNKATDASAFEGATYAQQLEAEADSLIANGVTIPVRCKECKHYDERNEDCNHPGIWAEYASDFGLGMYPDDFCSYGERREGE